MSRRVPGRGQPWLVVLLTLMVVAGRVDAQEARRSGDATARLQAALAQLQNEKSALQAENAGLKEKLARLEKDSADIEKARDDLQRRANLAETKVNRAEVSQETTQSRLAATEARLAEVIAKFRELAENLRKIEGERDTLAAQVTGDAQSLKSCAERNVELAAIGNDALDRYQEKGCWTALVQKEPFTQIKRAQIENAVQESRDRIQALTPPPAPAAPP